MEKEAITIRIPTNLKEKIIRISQQRGLTMNAIIVQALWNIK